MTPAASAWAGLTAASSQANLAALIRARLGLGRVGCRLLLRLEAKHNGAMVGPHKIILLVTFADLDSKVHYFRMQVSHSDWVQREDRWAASENDGRETH